MVGLLILDGWGHGPDSQRSAIAKANTPVMDKLYSTYPNSELLTHGEHVGLPEGQMGNSEVGHINIGAGRVVYQELARINKAIKDDTLKDNATLIDALSDAEKNHRRVHFIGLLSDGGVHSHINHLLALVDIVESYNIPNAFIHAFLDGRDTDPKSGAAFITALLEHIQGKKTKLSSVIGRYYAMDRDSRWERTAEAYHLLVNGTAKVVSDDVLHTIKDIYLKGTTDEFMESILIRGTEEGTIKEGDLVINFNFRTDRPRQITEVLTQDDKPKYDMYCLNIKYASMTQYDANFKNVDVLFTKDNLNMTLGEVLAQNGKKQLRIAETEKYPHVTFFFSGGREVPFDKEDRIMVQSPNVATYDLAPQMSAQEITQKLIDYVKKEKPDFVCLNFANADMVGHTGDFDAAVKAVETVDSCLGQILDRFVEKGDKFLVIADHGNSDYMVNDDGTPNTAHTTNPVPLIAVGKDFESGLTLKDGVLADIAPTILHILGVKCPNEMTGKVLLQ